MIKTLFVVNLKALATNFVRFGKNESPTGKLLLVAFVALAVVASIISTFAALFHSMLEPFFSVGIGWMYFTVLAIIVFSLCLISTIYTASAQLFGAKDNDLLLSMPIKPSAILISRLLVVLVLEYVFTLIAALPAFVIWVNGGYATALGILFFIIGVLLLPLMSTAVSLLLAWLLGSITSRLRHKNIITLTISIGFLFAYFYAVSNLQGYLNELLDKGEQLAEAFRQSMSPFYAFGMSVSEGSVSNELIFVLWAILPFAAAVIMLSTNYNKVITTNRGNVKIEYKEKATKTGSALSALVQKEMAHYWSKPYVILNSSLGALAMLAASVVVVVKKTDALLYVSQLTSAFGSLPTVALMAIALTFINTLNNISASLISLEGKNLWIAKSLPVPPILIIQSKMLTHLLISGLPCLVASICIATTFAVSAADWMIIILLPQTVGVLIAVVGVAINLHFPKFDWTNEIYVVKNGLSSMITLFGAMLMIAMLGVAYAFVLVNIVSLTVFLWICAAAFTAIAVAVYAWLVKFGTEMFAKL